MYNLEKIISQFNTPDTILVISSFPQKTGELAQDNAVSWYTHRLLTHVPSDQKIVIITEKRHPDEQIWKLKQNVVVIPTYSLQPSAFISQVLSITKQFSHVNKVMIQFEFNSFKNRLSTAAVPLLLAGLRSQRKRITFALHQVIEDVSALSGHLQIKSGTVQSFALNTVIKSFYRSLNFFADQVIVFDEELKQRLEKYIRTDKIAVIPMGTELNNKVSDRAAARTHFGLQSDAFVILAFGYLSWYKGTDWLVEEITKLQKAHPKKKIQLLLAGGQSPTVENEVFTAKLHKSLNKKNSTVVATGFVKDDEVTECFAAADLVVLPYRAMMSSSGTLSHTISYAKPFLVSEHLQPIFKHHHFTAALTAGHVQKEQIVFEMKSKDFQDKVLSVIESKRLRSQLKTVASTLRSLRSWKSIAKEYIQVVNDERISIKTPSSKEKLSELSVFFPLYNEEENVPRLVHHALAALSKVAKKYEVILVNDGSTDRTALLAENLAKKHKHVRVVHQVNGGYGKALRTGFESAKYDWVFFTDGDLQFDLRELSLFIPYAQTFDAIIGYRKNRADSAKRRTLAQMLKIWNTIFFSFPSHIKDIDCAYKLFNKKVVQSIFPLQSYGAMISTEMLLKVVDNGFSIKQVGVTHLPRKFGEPSGAKPHVIIGAMKETVKIVRERLTQPGRIFARV